MTINPAHITNAAKARELYLAELSPQESLRDWHFAVRRARKLVADALRASNYLNDIGLALRKNGGHNLVFRQLLAPPMSQDQFKLVCPEWSKPSENNCRPVPASSADKVAQALVDRLDRGVVRWSMGSKPRSRHDVALTLRVASTLMALQQVATARRSRLSSIQESAVVELLISEGWKKCPSKLIDTRAAVAPRTFMHKTRFATSTTSPQEVDIACGLANSYVLAMECKVTNDETNSVKRVNDVLKKAAAWRSHWGSFVRTAALLQGVISPKDVQRLTDGGVEVFWSHDLPAFRHWLKTQLP